MKKLLSSVLSVVVCGNILCASQEINSLDDYLNSVKLNGDLRLAYVGYNYKNTNDTYATGLGGSVNFNFPIYKENVQMNITPYFATSFDSLSGDQNKDEYEKTLSSKDKDYMMLGEANIIAKYNNLEAILGRQIINTPLMGDDDLRLTHQTFQGAMVNATFDNTNIYLGYFDKWQGYDAGLYGLTDKTFNEFQHMGTKDSDGTALLGVEYSNDKYNSRAYYYDIDKYSKVFYLDGGISYSFMDNLSIDFSMQYSNQKEENNSNIEAQLIGTSLGLAYNDFYFSMAYTKSSLSDNNSLFYGFGGEFFYTAMNEWCMGYLSAGEDEKAFSYGVSYDFNSVFNVSAYSAEFKTNSDKMTENDLFLTYSFADKLLGEIMYADVNDKKDSANSYENLIVRLTYSF